jgi:hypothetical protein
VLTLIATAILFLITLVQALLVPYLARARVELGWTDERYGWLMSANALVGIVIRAVAFGLLLVAVFLGRRRVLQAESDKLM